MNPKDTYNVSVVPFHTHNNVDSPAVKFSDILGKTDVISYTLFGTQSATAGNYSTFFAAPFALTVTGITEVHTVLGTDGSAVTLQVEKLTGTTAPGSGTNLLTTGFNLKSTINTVVTGSLVQTVGVIQVAAGDRFALKLSGTPTDVANVTVTITYTF